MLPVCIYNELLPLIHTPTPPAVAAAAAIIPLHQPRQAMGLVPSTSIPRGNINIEIITLLRMRVIIGSTAAIIATVLLPKATSGPALLSALADRHCCRPTPTTNDHDQDDDYDTTPFPSPPSRSSRHSNKAPQPGCEWAEEGATGRHPKKASSLHCWSRGKVA